MKKIAIMTALAFAAFSASAADVTAFASYDYDNLSNVSGVSLNRGNIGAKVGFGQYGSVDASVVGGKIRAFGLAGSDQGVEVGYSNGMQVGPVGVTARAAYAKLNESKADLMRVSFVGTLPVTSAITGVAGVEHIRVENEAVANRFTLGADFTVTKAVTVRAVAARTNFTIAGFPAANGVSTSVSYKF